MKQFPLFALMLVAIVALDVRAQDTKKVVIGMVAKSQSNPVFQAAYAGAKDAAKELGPKYGVDVTIDWQTPPGEDAQKQAEAIERLANGGAHGIAVSCSDANTVTASIDGSALFTVRVSVSATGSAVPSSTVSVNV